MRSAAHFVETDFEPLHNQELVIARLGRPGAEALRFLVACLHVGLALPEADGDRGTPLLIHEAQDPVEARPLPERRQHHLSNDTDGLLEEIRWTVKRTH